MPTTLLVITGLSLPLLAWLARVTWERRRDARTIRRRLGQATVRSVKAISMPAATRGYSPICSRTLRPAKADQTGQYETTEMGICPACSSLLVAGVLPPWPPGSMTPQTPIKWVPMWLYGSASSQPKDTAPEVPAVGDAGSAVPISGGEEE
ncbi:MAG TPA: hypothetical protein VIP09_16070 [Dehalococcoidia bacterium]|jgi:hypothetical protein